MSVISRSVCVCHAVAMSCEEMRDAIFKLRNDGDVMGAVCYRECRKLGSFRRSKRMTTTTWYVSN